MSMNILSYPVRINETEFSNLIIFEVPSYIFNELKPFNGFVATRINFEENTFEFAELVDANVFYSIDFQEPEDFDEIKQQLEIINETEETILLSDISIGVKQNFEENQFIISKNYEFLS